MQNSKIGLVRKRLPARRGGGSTNQGQVCLHVVQLQRKTQKLWPVVPGVDDAIARYGQRLPAERRAPSTRRDTQPVLHVTLRVPWRSVEVYRFLIITKVVFLFGFIRFTEKKMHR